MDNFSKREDPKVISNLSSNHSSSINLKKDIKESKLTSFSKRDSSTFHEMKVKYQDNINTIPNYTKTNKRKFIMPEVEYSEENKLLRPIEENHKILNIESDEKEIPKFTKSVTEPMVNPVHELFQNASTTTSKIEEKEDSKIPLKKENKKRKKFTFYILLAIFLEIILLFIIYFVRELNSKESLECKSENYNSYYEANIINTKKYYFKKGKIVSLEDTTEYIFDNEDVYNNFKEIYASPPYSVIDGRIIVSNINDNDYIYLEKAIYDYKKLRDKNKSSDSHNIIIPNDNIYDEINLIDYNITDIKIIYNEDYVCR